MVNIVENYKDKQLMADKMKNSYWKMGYDCLFSTGMVINKINGTFKLLKKTSQGNT